MSGTYTQNDSGRVEPAVGRRSNGMAIAALVCGIVGLFIFDFILGPLAIIFGGIGLRWASRGAGRRGMAWAGLILGIVDIVVLVVILALAKHHSFSWHVS
jgi:Domain of unknown function (DUF4190)